MGKKCLYCYQEVMGEEDFHPHCSQKFFGTTNPPILDYTLQEMEMLANKSLKLPLQFQEFSQNYQWASLKMF
jgi:serine/threonine-protein kinase HipA